MRAFVSAIQFLFVLGLGGSAFAQSQTLLSEDFESGATGWTYANGANGQWHVETGGTCTAITNMAAYTRVPSCTYNTGGANSGQLVSPAFLLGGQTPIRVGFQYIRFMDTAGDSTCVSIRVQGGTDWEDLGCSFDNSGTLQSSSLRLPDDYIGSMVEIGFRFNANSIGNNRRGWLIDNVQVTNSGPAIAPVLATVSPDVGQNNGTVGIQITGTDFLGVSSVKFGTLEASFSIDSPTQITAALEQSMLLGRKDVTVTSYAGSDVLPSAFSFWGAPLHVGEACDSFVLNWTGVPIIGNNYTVRTENLLLNNQVLLVSWSNAGASSPYHHRLGTLLGASPCSVLVDPTYVVPMGSSAVHTFAIPNDPMLVGTHLRTQALIRRTMGGPSVATQMLDVIIVD